MIHVINNKINNKLVVTEGGHGNLLQYSCLENPHGQRNLEGYSPWGGKELDTTKQLNTAQHSTLLLLFPQNKSG